jgi:hypothetical protein
LPAAIKHLSDHELEQLQAAITVEQQRRGKKPPTPNKTLNKRPETPTVTLTIGKLNAVRAAFRQALDRQRLRSSSVFLNRRFERCLRARKRRQPD